MNRSELLVRIGLDVPPASRLRGNWHMEPAPILLEDLTYGKNPDGKPIRVYDSIDVRMTLEDLFSKLELAYQPANTP